MYFGYNFRGFVHSPLMLLFLDHGEADYHGMDHGESRAAQLMVARKQTVRK
jgi:hypothetical protein